MTAGRVVDGTVVLSEDGFLPGAVKAERVEPAPADGARDVVLIITGLLCTTGFAAALAMTVAFGRYTASSGLPDTRSMCPCALTLFASFNATVCTGL